MCLSQPVRQCEVIYLLSCVCVSPWDSGVRFVLQVASRQGEKKLGERKGDRFDTQRQQQYTCLKHVYLTTCLSTPACLPVGLSVSGGVMCKPDSDFCDADRWTGLGNGTDCSWCDGTVIEVFGNFVELSNCGVLSRHLWITPTYLDTIKQLFNGVQTCRGHQ